MSTPSNTDLWATHGRHLLLVQPFMDSLIVDAEGCYLVDAEGRRILDLAAGQFCSILGYRHRKFGERLRRQAQSIMHLGDQYVSPGILHAAERVASITPRRLSRVLFLSTGSEANECAMRIAKTVTGRTGTVALSRAYHGITLATRTLSSISDHPGAADFQPVPPGQFRLLTPACHRCPIGLVHPACAVKCLNVSFEAIGDQLANVAAVFIEPVMSAGGMIFPPPDYVRALHERAKSAGALFIVDEAQTGFGRCGRWFEVESFGIEPDILVVSKTAGNGFPAAAVIVSEEVSEALEARLFTHLSSHQNDPLAAAAIHAVIDIVEEEGLVRRSQQMGAYFMAGLRALQQRHSLVKDVRGHGLMIGLELSTAGDDGPTLAFATAMLCEQRGVHVTYSYYEPVIRFIPPLVITEGEIDCALAVVDEVLTVLKARAYDLARLAPRNSRSGPFTSRMVGSTRSPARLIQKMWHTSPQQWLEKLKTLG